MNRQRQLKLALAAAGLLFGSSALAENTGFYFGLGGGISMPDLPSKSDFDASVAVAGLPFTSSLDDTGQGWQVHAGYRWNSYVAADVSYIDFGRSEYLADLVGDTVRYSVRYRSTGIAASVLGMLPLGERFDLHARAGVLFADTRVRQRIEDFATTEFDSIEQRSSSRDLFAGIGASWNINQSYSLRLEYSRFFDVGDDDHTGETDVDLLSFSVLFR